MRYFIEFAYNGTRFYGYQKQKQGNTIQHSIETALSTIIRNPIKIVGCGRTDAGVHAAQFFAHFDTELSLDAQIINRLNKLTSNDILFYNLYPVHKEAHARFDANSRSYSYHIDFIRSPFRQETSFYCTYAARLDITKMQDVAHMLLKFDDFKSFCKSKSDVKTTLCSLTHSEWTFNKKKQQLTYNITANRFLRGMIRLIVGTCLNVGTGKIEIAQVQTSIETKQIIPHALSVPAKGLFLKDILYDYINIKE